MIPLLLALSALSAPPPDAGAFLVKPHLQIGRDSQTTTTKSVTVVWHSDSSAREWACTASDGTVQLSTRQVRASGIAPHQIHVAQISGLTGGADVRYEIRSNGNLLYAGSARAPKGEGQPFRFAVFGDFGRGTPGQKRIAKQVYAQKPDLAVITGDVVYPHGRMSEYRQFFYPMANADVASRKAGAPLMRSMLVVAAAGNHDTAYRNLNRYPDGLAFYPYWVQPLNGPDIAVKTSGSTQHLQQASGGAFPKGTNFSFDFGDAHWTVLDSNVYLSWRNSALRKWLEDDLRRSTKKWRFVAFHSPPFQSSPKHAGDDATKVLTDLFAKHRVDLVFCGHVHNYQRSRPYGPGGALDYSFDGKKDTTPQAPVYVITGAGGAELYDQKLADRPGTWKPFTAAYKGGYSFTLVDVNGSNLTLRQISADGKELDRIRITKP